MRSARGGLQTEEFAAARGVGRGDRRARAVCWASGWRRARSRSPPPTAGADLVKLAQDEAVDLLLIDGRRPLLGGGVPRGDVGAVLEKAPCDVAVLVARESVRVAPGSTRRSSCRSAAPSTTGRRSSSAAWLSSATGAPLKLLGSAGQTRRTATRAACSATRRCSCSGSSAWRPSRSSPSRGATRSPTRPQGAGLLVVGLSDRWRQEGLGPTRSEIASSAPAPILFVRRGERAGALAPRDDVTRFTWSSPAIGTVAQVPLPPTSTT